jgi:ribose transport system substrate-binding protein
MKRLALAAALAAMMSGPALAQDFHGYDPATFDGFMLPAENLAAMVTEAMAKTPPRNGTSYVIGFANLQRDIPFCALVEQGILENAKAAGLEVTVADNRLDGATALANAESFITRNVDLVIEFQTDAAFGETIMQKMDAAGIPVIAIDIPMGTATFFGVNNPRAGFMGGSYLAQAAIAEFGKERVMEGFFINGELPQSGPIPAMRNGGQNAGFLGVLPDFPKENMLSFDSKNTLDEAFAQTTNLLARIPEDAVIMGTGINDQVATGILRAAQTAGREDIVVVGLGADMTESLVNEPDYVAAVGSFPERYGNSLIPMSLAILAGRELPDSVLINHVMVTKQNVCEFYPNVACAEGEGIAYEFPQAAFEAHLASLRENPDLADVQNLIPAN